MTSEEEKSRQELIERIRAARGVLSQASGWVRALSADELKPYGIDIRPEVGDSLDGIVVQMDEIIDMLNGDRLVEARALYRYKWPEVKQYIDLARALWKVFSL